MSTVKQKLFNLCMEAVLGRIGSIRSIITVTQAAASEETKSSAGDKYETGRAMAQLEIEKLGTQLEEALRAKEVLEKIKVSADHTIVQTGSVVTTSQGNFFISISAGPFEVEGNSYYPVSAASPIGHLLLGKKAGDTYSFRGKEARVLNVT